MKKKLYIGAVLAFFAALFTVLVKTIDIQQAGPRGSSVGFGSFNSNISSFIGVDMALYNITEVLGIVALAIAAAYGAFGLIQLIKAKNIKKVEKGILALGGLFVVAGLIYVFFEKFIINYRPVILDGELEASFPSSHTVLALCISVGAILLNKKIYTSKLVDYLNIFLIMLATFIVSGRFLSGVHWATDITGGILISSTLLVFFSYALDRLYADRKSIHSDDNKSRKNHLTKKGSNKTSSRESDKPIIKISGKSS